MKHFFRTAFLFAILFALSVCTAQDSYRVIFLGDTHYDAEDVNLHPEGISKAYPRDIEMWKERLPKLLTAANQKAAESNTAFVLQAGDMVEGGSGTAAAHKNMLEAGYKKLQSYFSVPVLTTCGNHDISTKIRKGEPYPAQIYEKFLQQNVLPALNKTEGIKVLSAFNNNHSSAKTNIAFRYGKDLYLLMNFNSYGPDFDKLKEVLEQNADARYKIILSHAGPLPWDRSWRPEWRLYGYVKMEKEKRDAALELFQKYNCIFLTGHYHGVSYLEYATEKGTIHQLMNSCVWTPDITENFAFKTTTPDNYGSRILATKIISREAAQELVNTFKPGIKKYYNGNGAGYMTLDLNDQNITVNYYHRDENTPSATFTITTK